MHDIAITALLVFAQTLPSESTKTAHRVPLITSKPKACLSVPAGQGVSLVLDNTEVTEMAAPRRNKWKTEAERMQLVRARQAQMLIKQISGKTDLHGCNVIDQPGDGIYALLEIMNRGQGRVWDKDSNSFLPMVERLEYNLDCSQGRFGTFTFRKSDGKEFLYVRSCSV